MGLSCGLSSYQQPVLTALGLTGVLIGRGEKEGRPGLHTQLAKSKQSGRCTVPSGLCLTSGKVCWRRYTASMVVGCGPGPPKVKQPPLSLPDSPLREGGHAAPSVSGIAGKQNHCFVVLKHRICKEKI